MLLPAPGGWASAEGEGDGSDVTAGSRGLVPGDGSLCMDGGQPQELRPMTPPGGSASAEQKVCFSFRATEDASPRAGRFRSGTC